MTENEYSIVTDLASVRSVKSVLMMICPECGSDSIKKEEWQDVMQILMRWESRLNDAVIVLNDLDEEAIRLGLNNRASAFFDARTEIVKLFKDVKD